MTSASDNAIARLSAVEIAGKIRAKELSALEVTEASLRRMEAVEPYIHAYCVPTPELARETAAEIDRKIAAGEDAGPLGGVPIGIKDLVATKGIETAMGSNLYKGWVPEEDDIVVERLKAAGAVILGKTNVPEFGYSGVGHNPLGMTTRNPWNLAMTPGGSSAGSGASVACGVTPFAIGSDGGGSSVQRRSWTSGGGVCTGMVRQRAERNGQILILNEDSGYGSPGLAQAALWLYTGYPCSLRIRLLWPPHASRQPAHTSFRPKPRPGDRPASWCVSAARTRGTPSAASCSRKWRGD